VAKTTGSSRRSINLWSEGAALPRVESLFRLCFHVGVSVLNFLRGAESEWCAQKHPESAGTTGPAVAHVQGDEKGCSITSGRVANLNPVSIEIDVIRRSDDASPKGHRRLPSEGSKRVDRQGCEKENRLRSALEQAVSSGLSISPRKLAMEIGYHSPDRVLLRFSDLTRALKSKFTADRDARCHEIRTRLEESLALFPPPTLNAVAISLKMINSSGLRTHEPALCDELLATRQRWEKAQGEKARANLRAALQAGQLPSLKKLCRDNGISVETVASCFPELRLEHRTRYQAQINRNRVQRMLWFQSEVERAVRSIRARDEYPSVGRVVAEDARLRSFGWHQIQQAIRMALGVLDPKERGIES
jgi:hypothetical protein